MTSNFTSWQSKCRNMSVKKNYWKLVKKMSCISFSTKFTNTHWDKATIFVHYLNNICYQEKSIFDFFFKIKGENSIIWFLARKVKYLKKWWKLHNVIFGAKIQMFKRFWWLLLKSNLIFWREKSTFMHFWYFIFSGKIQISFLTIFQFLTKIELLSQCVR